MNATMVLEIIKTVYPAIRDTAGYLLKRRGSFTPTFKEHIRKMVVMTEADLGELKAEVENVRRLCAELNLPMGAVGGVPWQIPHDVNCYLTWRYRRTSRKIEDVCSQFRASMDGVMDVIACCAGIMAGDEVSSVPYTETEWSRNLGRAYEELCEKVGRPERSSIDMVTNAMTSFLEQARFAMQELAKAVG